MAWASQQGSVLPTKLDTGNWFVDGTGSWACKTDFKSKVKVVSPDGKDLKYSNYTQDGDKTITFDKVVQGSTIEWEIETLADKKKPASDRATIELTYLDTQYVALLTNRVLAELTEAQKQEIAAGNTNAIEPLIEQYLDINNAEYQVHGNNIEIYPLEKSVIRIKFNNSEIEIISQAKEYSFDKINNNFFSQLQSLIS